MPHECQAVLLRFLQEGTIERLGGNGPINMRCPGDFGHSRRSEPRPLKTAGSASDLYHRLCVLRLVRAPLRERGGDIKLLANYALSMYRHDGARKIRGLSSDAIVAMSSYGWPGNVRELINCVRRAVVMSEGRFITASDLGLPEADNGPAVTLAEIRSKAEKDAIEHALQRHGYKLSEAAAELGISRATLYRLMHANRLHQEPPAGRASSTPPVARMPTARRAAERHPSSSRTHRPAQPDHLRLSNRRRRCYAESRLATREWTWPTSMFRRARAVRPPSFPLRRARATTLAIRAQPSWLRLGRAGAKNWRSPRRSSGRAWRLSTARSSTSALPSIVSTDLGASVAAAMPSESSTRTSCFSRHLCWWADRLGRSDRPAHRVHRGDRAVHAGLDRLWPCARRRRR